MTRPLSSRPLSLESRMRLLTLRLPNGCHQWIGRKLDGEEPAIKVRGKLKSAIYVAAWLAKMPRPTRACKTRYCLNPLHAVSR